MTTLAVAYTFLCLGFCLGFVVCSVFRVGQQADSSRAAALLQVHLAEGDRLANAHRPRKWDGPVPPPPPAACVCGYLRCVCPAGTPQ